ncbi:MAG: hypothetical protein N2C12_10860, partial [Planctomycetales bacterium]
DVVPPATNDVLDVTISDLDDEVPVGSEIVYVVTVKNIQKVADQNVVVVITAPEGMTPILNSIEAPSDNPVIDGRVVRFQPVAEIRPDEPLPLTYKVPLRADQAGSFQVQVQVTSNAQRRPILATVDSTVFEE